MIKELATKIREKQAEIAEFIADNLQQHQVPVYSSYDIRCNGFRAAAVDANLFPAGYNNVCRGARRAASQVLEQIIRKEYGPDIKRIGLYAENHTRNSFYFQNLCCLQELIQQAGFRCLVAGTNPGFKNYPVEVEGTMGDKVTIFKLQSRGGILYADDRELDLVISNNDFSTEVPEQLQNSQTSVIPSPALGWWNRSKHQHFEHQKELFQSLGKKLNLDPWLLYPTTRHVAGVDFEDQKGFKKIAGAIDEINESTAQKYNQYQLDEKPRAFVKSNQGTYGMGVYAFESGRDFLNINRSRRDSMGRRKGGGKNNEVIVQEGVRTIDRVSGLVAEPVIYCLEHRPIGGFLRTNEDRDDLENLNSRGMNFTSEDLCPLFIHDAQKNIDSNLNNDRIEIYKFLATIASLAAAREQSELVVQSND